MSAEAEDQALQVQQVQQAQPVGEVQDIQDAQQPTQRMGPSEKLEVATEKFRQTEAYAKLLPVIRLHMYCPYPCLKNCMLYSNGLFMVLGLYFVTIGILIAGNVRWQEAYGDAIETLGISVCCIGVVILCISCVGCYGTRHHNKFVLLVFLVFVLLGVGGQMSVGSVLNEMSSAELDETCLDGSAPFNETGPCRQFLTNKVRMGAYFAWQRMWRVAHSGEDYEDVAQMMKDVQRDGQCCGFGAPRRCIQDSNMMEFTRELEPERHTSVQLCGRNASYYCLWSVKDEQLSSNCVEAAMVFDFPIGGCENSNHNKRGCAAEVVKMYNAQIGPLGNSAMFLVFIQLIAFCSGALLLCKDRREFLEYQDEFYEDAFNAPLPGTLPVATADTVLGDAQAEEHVAKAESHHHKAKYHQRKLLEAQQRAGLARSEAEKNSALQDVEYHSSELDHHKHQEVYHVRKRAQAQAQGGQSRNNRAKSRITVGLLAPQANPPAAVVPV